MSASSSDSASACSQDVELGELSKSTKMRKTRRRFMRWIAPWRRPSSCSSKDQPTSDIEAGLQMTDKPSSTTQDGTGRGEANESDRGDAGSVHSRRSNGSARSANSRRSRRSASSFRSFKSHFSRLSTRSGSSQRSYENPVLESVQTILDLVTKIEAENKPTVFGAGVWRSAAREIQSAGRYMRTVQCLKSQVEGYAIHPAVLLSGVHTSPRELVLLCDTVRQINPNARDTVSVAVNSDILNQVSTDLKDWFEAFLVAPKDDEQSYRYHPFRAYVPSPLSHEVHPDMIPGEGDGEPQVVEAAQPVNNPTLLFAGHCEQGQTESRPSVEPCSAGILPPPEAFLSDGTL